MKGAENPIVTAGLEGLHQLYQTRAITPVEALQAYIARIERLNGGLNALVHEDFARARRDAAASAQRWAKGKPRSPLDGAPIGVKANIAIEGLPWTNGVTGWGSRVAQEDAAIVRHLRQSGALIVGALNMHEAALGATNDGPLYGKCFNPLRPGFTPGGSSGGSGCAVAAGLVAAALGSDTMGSVRIPAAYCGGVGFKPSFGRLSRAGVAPLSWTLDHVGLHTRSAGDLRALLKHTQGFDPRDPGSLPFAAARAVAPIQGLKVGRVRFEDHVEVEPEIAALFDDLCVRLQGEGALIVDVGAGADWFSPARRMGLLVSEAEGAVTLCSLRDLPGALSPSLEKMLAFGAGQSAEKVARAHFDLQAVRCQVRLALAPLDCLLLPTAPQVAFSHAKPAPVTQADLTAFANAAGVPALAMPMGPGREGLPASVQILTHFGGDHAAIEIAASVAAFM